MEKQKMEIDGNANRNENRNTVAGPLYFLVKE